MRAQKKKKRSGTPWLVLLGYMLIGAGCGILIMMYLDHIPEGQVSRAGMAARTVLLFLCMYGAMLAQIVIHEAGHLVFGLATGYRFSSFRVFSLMWVKEEGRIRLRKMSLAGTGGQCLMSPPDLKDGKIPAMLYNFGGVLLNLITALVFAGAAFLFPARSFGQTALLFPAVMGAAYALMNGIPLSAGAVNNDGRNALDISRSPEAAKAFWIQMKANELTSRGVRLRDMPAEWFAMPPDEAMDNPITASAGVLACNRLMDEKRFGEADRQMEHILSRENGVVGLYRGLLICDRIFTELIGPCRRDVLDGMLDKEQKKFMKSMGQYPSVLRTEYACALLGERDMDKAAAVRKRFEKTAGTYPYPSEIAGERELMDLAAGKAQEGEQYAAVHSGRL